MNDGSDQPPPRETQKVLLVEEDPASQEVMADFLRQQGYEVLVCEDGGHVVGQTTSFKPDLILLNLELPTTDPFSGPSLDGLQVMDWLRHMMGGAVPPIIATSRRGDNKDKAISSGAQVFFQKPVNGERLLLAIRIALGQE